ncbi:hypothetical protein GOBAR_DD20074 [Gossypium barbadense]|nr:hypothetical protein GOBAR_DD20074 [Gossypium barbadense]
MAEAIVIYPAPLLTHQTPMVEFAKLLLTHHPSLSIHILIATTLPFQPPSSAVPPNITCHYLPAVDLPPPSTHPLSLLFNVIRLNNPDFRRALLTISNNYTLNAVIFDFFCTRYAFEVVSDLNIPAYCFCTVAAGSLASLLYLPTLHNKFTQNFQDLNVLVDIPGVPPIPSSDMPSPVLKRNEWYEIFLNNSTCLPHLAGIIVNTFECLESKAIKAIRDGLCVPEFSSPSSLSGRLRFSIAFST